jgi:hypothetical protein
MKKTVSMTATAMLIAAGLLGFQGCRNALQAPSGLGNEGKGGTITLTMGEARGRAILPAVTINSFDRFELSFTSTTGGAPVTITDWTPTNNTVDLEGGTWNLDVIAFQPTDTIDHSAQGSANGFTVSPNANTPVSVTLTLIDDAGEGSFSWNIGFASDVTVTSAQMTVSGQAPVDLVAQSAGSLTMASGEYDVTIDMTNSEGENVIIGPQVLRVYRNFDSPLAMTVSLEHFPVTALNYILRSWNGTAWDFAGWRVSAALFGYAGILGITDDAHLATLKPSFDAITLAAARPGNLAQLGQMVDVGLVANGFLLEDQEDQTGAQAAASAVAANGAVALGNWTYPAADSIQATVTAGAYSSDLGPVPYFAGPADVTGTATVGQTLTAAATAPTGAGAPTFEWRRHANAGLTDPPVVVGTAANTYVLQTPDAYNYVTAWVKFAGAFGSAVAAPVGPVSAGSGTATITIDLADIYDNKIDAIYPAPFNMFQDSPTVTVNGAPTNVEWFYGGVSRGTAPSFTLTQAMHGNRIGRHTVTVQATLGGNLYSLLIEFVVEP